MLPAVSEGVHASVEAKGRRLAQLKEQLSCVIAEFGIANWTITPGAAMSPWVTRTPGPWPAE